MLCNIARIDLKKALSIIICIILLSGITGCGASTSASVNQVSGPFDYKSVPMTAVDSTAIAEEGYDSSRHILLIRFRSNSNLYAYYDVPESVYNELTKADSHGTYFNKNIRDSFDYERLDSGANYKEQTLYHETTRDKATYALNKNSGKFHRLNCGYAKGDNVVYVSDSKADLEGHGYDACKKCKP